MKQKRELIRSLLSEYSLTHGWLVKQLNKRGLDISSNEFSACMTGRKRDLRAEITLNLSIAILECYVELYELEVRKKNEGVCFYDDSENSQSRS